MKTNLQLDAKTILLVVSKSSWTQFLLRVQSVSFSRSIPCRTLPNVIDILRTYSVGYDT